MWKCSRVSVCVPSWLLLPSLIQTMHFDEDYFHQVVEVETYALFYGESFHGEYCGILGVHTPQHREAGG